MSSVLSRETSDTYFSIHGGYSETQIDRATTEFISILRDDPSLVPLYKQAIEDYRIGPERLERNLCRLFRAYASHLRKVAGNTLEIYTSRLVHGKSSTAAGSIVRKYGRSTESILRCFFYPPKRFSLEFSSVRKIFSFVPPPADNSPYRPHEHASGQPRRHDIC